MAAPAKRLLGLTFDGRPIWEPKPGHSLLLAAAGGGKTTCGAVPWLMSLLKDRSRAIVVNDCKDGEITAQMAALCAAEGRKVVVLDDFGVLGSDNPFRVSLSPFSGIAASYGTDDQLFTLENANHALIEEVSDDAKNAYWRDEPRSLIEFAVLALMARNPRFATPGGVWSLLSDPMTLAKAAELEAEDGDQYSQSLATHVQDMRTKNQEHFAQHRGAALKALRIYGAGSPLHRAGADADLFYHSLIAEKAIIFIVGPQRHIDRMGPHYALHLLSIMEAQFAAAGPVDYILDEFTNAPLKALVSRLTTMRGYGGRCHMIAQSHSEIERRYGEKETRTIEEQALIKQWFSFTSYDQAERVSKAIGEAQTVDYSMGVQSEQMGLSGTLSTGKERIWTPDRLMGLPPTEQIVWAKGVGFIHCLKVWQNQIAPYASRLAPNPLEGAPMPPDIKVDLEEWS